MILELIEYYFQFYINNNVSFYLILRSFFSLISSWLISLFIGPHLIFWLRRLKVYQMIRSSGPVSHFVKKDTPTIGGIIILFSAVFSILLWTDLCNRYVWYVIFILISYGFIGCVDDYLKIFRKDNYGLSISLKYSLLSIIALLFMIFVFIREESFLGTRLVIPFFNGTVFQLGVWYVFLGYLVIVGTSNSVNLSDGLDGLAIMSVVCISVGLGIISLIASNIYFANYFHIRYIVFLRELVVICSAIVGSGLGFLWFNTYPAQIFMGDTGSLSLGGALGVIAILLRQEFVLFIMGGILVLEAISVIVQVFCFRFFGFRVFRMAPIHHHFELRGLPEPCIVIRFWIVSVILVLIGLVVLRYVNYD